MKYPSKTNNTNHTYDAFNMWPHGVHITKCTERLAAALPGGGFSAPATTSTLDMSMENFETEATKAMYKLAFCLGLSVPANEDKTAHLADVVHAISEEIQKYPPWNGTPTLGSVLARVRDGGMNAAEFVEYAKKYGDPLTPEEAAAMDKTVAEFAAKAAPMFNEITGRREGVSLNNDGVTAKPLDRTPFMLSEATARILETLTPKEKEVLEMRFNGDSEAARAIRAKLDADLNASFERTVKRLEQKAATLHRDDHDNPLIAALTQKDHQSADPAGLDVDHTTDADYDQHHPDDIERT